MVTHTHVSSLFDDEPLFTSQIESKLQYRLAQSESNVHASPSSFVPDVGVVGGAVGERVGRTVGGEGSGVATHLKKALQFPLIQSESSLQSAPFSSAA